MSREFSAQICVGDGECVTLAAKAQMVKLTLDTVDPVIFSLRHLIFRRTVILRSWKIHNRNA